MTEEKKISIEEFEKIVNTAENSNTQLLSKNMLKTLVILIIFGIYLLIPKTFWLVPSEYSKEKINTENEPVIIKNEENINASAQIKQNSKNENLIKYKSLKNGETYYLMPLAEYSISAKIKEKNRFFYMQWEIDNVALVDYGLTWGDMAKDFYYKKIYANSNQSVMGRMLVFNFKKKYYNSLRNKFDYMLTHVSHTHAIPANKNIKKALIAAREGQTIKLDGYLVDVFSNSLRRFAITSLSLSDEGFNNGRGGGACEIMYVTKVQIGDKVFD